MACSVTAWCAVPAHADSWRAPDAAGDVIGYSFTPEPPPCGTLTQTHVPADTTTDIVGLAVRHRHDTVALAARFRDLGMRPQVVSFAVETDGRSFEVRVERRRTGGPARASVFVTSPPEAPTPDDEFCSYTTAMIGGPCRGQVADMSAEADRVAVTLPRRCLRDPRWIRAGVEAYRFLDRGGVRRDRWAPAGADETAFVGPLGPRVRRG